MSSAEADPKTSAADSSEFVQLGRKLLESVEVGLAIVDAETYTPLLINRRFEEWLGGQDLSAVMAAVPGLEWAELGAKMSDGDTRQAEIELKIKRRAAVIALRVSAQAFSSRRFLVVEAGNVSKLKELEYMMESYAKMLEKNERDLRREKDRAERLLLNIMPRRIYEDIKAIGVTTPQRYDECSILMLDFVGFTEMSVAHDPAALIAELNDLFTAFDRIVEQFGCERIKTIGDAYMAVSGLPEPAPDHAANIARAALRMVRYLERRNLGQASQWRCRIGINSGPVIGSIVGAQKFLYDIFGPGVNLAARLEALSGPMEITLCDTMAPLLQSEFLLEEKGEVEVRGFGTRRLFALLGESLHTRP
jgi:class 3 adenylate cyclase